MSNKNPDSGYNDLNAVITFALQQSLKDIHTSMPAIIVDYNATTKRAVVQPAIKIMYTNEEYRSRPLVGNVPVIHPAGGGYVIHIPLAKGDPVMLVFSERGLTDFKKTLKESNPDIDSILAVKDAVVFPGFGSKSITPAGDGITIQTESGETFIELKNGVINITAPQGLTITGDVDIAGNVTTTGTLINNDVAVGSTHTHTGVHGGTSPPV